MEHTLPSGAGFARIVHMNVEVAIRQAKLRELCQQFSVERLDLFGSAASDDFDPAKSDIDLVVTFGRTPADMDGASQYFGLLRSLEALFGRHVDLLEESAIQNRFMIRELSHTRIPVYHAA